MAVSDSQSRLQAYKISKQIGKGSYGEVFLVTSQDGEKKYVMKNIKLTSSSAKERLGAEQEAALLSRLRHPNIVSYKESFQDECGILHIVMGYCEGGDLCSRLKTYGDSFLPEAKVVEWFVQITLALQYIHERNILHRDLKTQNIFLSKNDIIKVGDLGIARVLDGSCDLAHTVIGTPYYMSPELFANQPYNHKSDIWALGCCVYEMASLKHAFSARNINALMFKIIRGKVPPIPSHYSTELVGLVQIMMARNAEERPSVHQILRMSFIRGHIKMFLEHATSRKSKKKPSLENIQPLHNIRHVHVHSEPSKQMQIQGNDSDNGLSEAADRMKLEISAEQQIEPSRSISLTDLEAVQPQLQKDDNSNSDSSQSPNPNNSKRIHRPLPPDPVPLTNGGSVSSARQRRRRSKQKELHGKIVLRSNSSSNISKSHDKRDGVGVDHNHSNQQKSDTPLHSIRLANDEPDFPDPPVENDPSSDEIDEFFNLLDSTLHLPEEPDPMITAALDRPPPRIAFVAEGKGSLLSSGRLADRIKALRHECVSGLGVVLFQQVYKLLAQSDPEETEEDLKTLLGMENFELYAAKLHQLKLCEDSLSH